MSTILTVTIPFFAVIACGYAAGRFKILSDAARIGVNSFVFYFALPVLLFALMARADLAARFDWAFVAAYLIVSIGLFAVVAVTARTAFRLNMSESAILSLSGVYGNTGYVGIPLVVVAFGDAASIPMILCLILDLVVMIPLAVALIETERGTDTLPFDVLVKTALAIARNPLILAIASGAVVSLSSTELPATVEGFLNLLGAAAAPCALFALGASLVGRPIGSARTEIGFITTVKLVVHPLAIWFVMFQVFAVAPDWGLAAVIAASMPVAATVFVVAQQYDVYVVRCSGAILISTVLSVVTISLFLAFLTPALSPPTP